MVGRTKAGFEQIPFNTDLELVPPIKLAIEADRLGAFHLNIQFQMVLQVFTNTGQIMDNINAVFAQMVRRPDARKHQKFWRVDGSGRDNHFSIDNRALVFALMGEIKTNGTFPFENNTLRQCLVIDGQVRTFHRRMQISARR